MSPAGANLSPEAAAPGKRRLLLRERSCRGVITAAESPGHSRKPESPGGRGGWGGEGTPTSFCPPIASFCQDLRVWKFPSDPSRRHQPVSSKDSQLSLSPKGLSEVLSDPSTSSSFCLLFFSCGLQCWEVQPRASCILSNCFAPVPYSLSFLICIERQGLAKLL